VHPIASAKNTINDTNQNLLEGHLNFPYSNFVGTPEGFG
jgi:hypothetical protein